jgi:hypothetical protein
MIDSVIQFYRERFEIMASGEQGLTYLIFVFVVGGVVFPALCMGLARAVGLFGKELRQ